jgi:serine/threonine-protein kinase HipA
MNSDSIERIDYNAITKANVYLRDQLAGRLEKLSNTQFKFEYDPTWIKQSTIGIGLNLPIEESPYVTSRLHPFFDNLIPEGWLLSYAEQVYKIDKYNRFALLMATGKEPIGAVRVYALDVNEKEFTRRDSNISPLKNLIEYDVKFQSVDGRCPYCMQKLTEKQLKANPFHTTCAKKMWGSTKKLTAFLDKEEPVTSFRRAIYGGSISGAQRKGLFQYDKGNLIPTHAKAEYILKPPGDSPNLPENEHLTMSIAKAIGFTIPPLTIFHIEGVGCVFAIKRFDLTSDKIQLRLEDAGQVLQVPSSDKYNSSYEKLSKAIQQCSDAPIADLLDYWQRIVFSFFIANGDMHLKNWSFLEQPSMKGVFKLSPCYDFLNTRLPIPDEEIDIGLALNGRKHQIKLSMFIELAQRLNISHLTQDTFDSLDKWMSITTELTQSSYLDLTKQKRYLEIVNSRYQVLKGNATAYI